MNLNPIYRRYVVYPCVVMIPLLAIFSGIINRDYKSEWLTSASVIQMDILAGLAYCAIMCLLSLTIFLNRYESVKSSHMMSTLSWFAAPGALISITAFGGFKEYICSGNSYYLFYTAIYTLPFAFGLIPGYLRFRQSNMS